MRISAGSFLPPDKISYLIIRKDNDFVMRVKEVEFDASCHLSFGPGYKVVETPFKSLKFIKVQSYIVGYVIALAK